MQQVSLPTYCWNVNKEAQQANSNSIDLNTADLKIGIKPKCSAVAEAPTLIRQSDWLKCIHEFANSNPLPFICLKSFYA